MSTEKYNQHGQFCGPVETPARQALVRDGTPTPDTPVQKEGMTDGVAARAQTGLGLGGPPPDAFAAEPTDEQRNKVFALVAYIGPLFLVPLLLVPQSSFARYHTNQGAVLFFAALLTSIVSVVLARLPLVGWLGGIVSSVIGLGALALMVLGILNALAGRCKPLPLIGQFEVIK